MNKPENAVLEEYYRDADTWYADRERAAAASQRNAWILVGILATIALVEAIALVVLLPLKTVVPYTLLVDIMRPAPSKPRSQRHAITAPASWRSPTSQPKNSTCVSTQSI